MSIFLNGEKIGEDASLTTALSDYPGAQFGRNMFGKQNNTLSFKLAEFKAYTEAFTDTEIQSLSTNFIEKYGL